MKGIVFAFACLILVMFGALYFAPLNKILNLPGKFGDIIPKISPSPAAINTPKDCSGQLTPNMTDGPYYKEGSPVKTVLSEASTVGERFTLTGYVFDTNCNPIEGAWIDFWQADGSGEYDNTGYKLRGHQFTDSVGKYYLETVVPGEYTSRTPHIHVKVRANENSPIVTAQLYFPKESRNANDPIFDQQTLIKVTEDGDGKTGTYNFVVGRN